MGQGPRPGPRTGRARVTTALAPELVDDTDHLMRVCAEHPLRFAHLWDRPLPRTSQRRAFQQLGEVVTVVCGGNRSGKSDGSSQLAIATALGGRHPDARAWCRNNGLDPAILPQRPGRVWAVALDSGDSVEYLRPTYAKYLPPGSKWRNQHGNGRASVTLPGGGYVGFLSIDMGRDGFQGGAVDLVHVDEEPPGSGHVLNEIMMRLVDRRGRLIVSMTPLRGLTHIYDRWVANTPEDVRVHYIHGADNPHLPAGALDRMLRQYGTHERAARARGEWTTLEGRVYAEWARHLHVVPAVPIPPEWTLTGCMDFGTRAPAVFLLLAHDHATDTIHVIAEHYRAEWTISQHARAIKGILAGRECSQIVVDPEDRGARLSLSRDHGIVTVPAKKGPGSVRSGINAVCERLAPSAVDGLPGLVVHEGKCQNLVREMESYIWDDRAGGTKDAPKPGQSDHALDALRYGIGAIGAGLFGAG